MTQSHASVTAASSAAMNSAADAAPISTDTSVHRHTTTPPPATAITDEEEEEEEESEERLSTGELHSCSWDVSDDQDALTVVPLPKRKRSTQHISDTEEQDLAETTLHQSTTISDRNSPLQTENSTSSGLSVTAERSIPLRTATELDATEHDSSARLSTIMIETSIPLQTEYYTSTSLAADTSSPLLCCTSDGANSDEESMIQVPLPLRQELSEVEVGTWTSDDIVDVSDDDNLSLESS